MTISRLPDPSSTSTPTTLPRLITAGIASARLVCLASSSIARKMSGAKTAVHARSQTKVPTRLAPTRLITFQRNASSGKGSRWMSALSSGKAPHAHAAHMATTAKTERKSG